jgi:hypothetical protein
MATLHTLCDGSVLRRMNARELITYSPWQGNRIMDTAHAESLESGLHGHYDHLDHLYKLITIRELDASDAIVEKIYIIDGQHRAAVISHGFRSNPLMDDFVVLVTIKRVASEAEAITYFKTLNRVKPIDWKDDPKLIVNKYVAALEEKFTVKKPRRVFIRTDTKFPYLSMTLLRAALEKECARSPLSDNDADVSRFVDAVDGWNTSMVTGGEVPTMVPRKERGRWEKAFGIGFVLAVDSECRWIETIRRRGT